MAAQIMKSDEDVRMISAEAPVLFARVSHSADNGSVPSIWLLPSVSAWLLLPKAEWFLTIFDIAGMRDVHSGVDVAILESL